MQFDRTALEAALAQVYGAAWAFGQVDALNDLGSNVGFNWDTWVPGNAGAAALVDPPGGLQDLLDARGVTIRGLDQTTIDRIGTALATGLDQGLSASETASLIDGVLGDPSRAMTIARTETANALIQANLETYRDANVESVEWLVGDPCEICADNAGVVVPLGEEFPSGDTEPPAHPNCVCDIAPVLEDVSDTYGAEPQPAPEEDVVAEDAGDAVHDGVIDENPDAAQQLTREQDVARTEFIPDRWLELNKDEMIQSEIQRFERMPMAKYYKPDYIQEKLTKDGPTLKFLDKGAIYKNGTIEIHVRDRNVTGLTAEMLTKLQKAVQDLQLAYPKDKLVVHVGGMTHKTAYGEAVLGDHDIRLNPTETIVKGQVPNLAEAGKWKMPVLAEVDRYMYTLAHEWGHTMDSVDRSVVSRRITSIKRQNPDSFKSGYSLKNTKEFYAEMFAEYYLTGGTTTNALAQAMAKEFGWNR